MSSSDEFDFGADTFDSREVIDRIAYLEIDEEALDEDEKQELADLRAFAEEAEDSVADWEYGEQFIRDDYFVEYAQQLAEDIGAIDRDLGWPSSYIDWNAAAEALKQDYTSFTLHGFEYWAR